jgi:nucleotide-binding universal stress UspA family protein
MYRNVLVPVDGSALAENALPWALAAATPSGTVHLVHVHEYVAPMEVEGMIMVGPPLDQERWAAEEEYLGKLADRVRAAAPTLTVATRQVEPDGPFDEMLTRAVTESTADLVVMATHGRGPFARFFLGSVADDLVRHSPVPVLVLHPSEPDTPVDLGRRPNVRHVLVPVDGSLLAEEIIPPASRLGRALGGEFTVLLVLESGPRGEVLSGLEPIRLPDEWEPSPAEDQAKRYLDRVARVLRDSGVTVHTKLESRATPTDAILDYIRRHSGTLVALATHARSGLTRLLTGSVADEVIRKGSGPVLVFHPPGC